MARKQKDAPVAKYEVTGNQLFRNTSDSRDQLTNWWGVITRQLLYIDGDKQDVVLVINAELADGTKLPEVTVPATEFATMKWVPQRWGMDAVIFPASGAERDIATAMQLNSKPEKVSIYTATGWHRLPSGEDAYLTKSGALTRHGLDESVVVQLPSELQRYAIPAPYQEKDGIESAVAASLKLTQIGPLPLTWPLLLATYRAPIDDADFAIHLAGRTGSFKSETVSLFQSHFGAEMDARHLPASWSSTANATEALAYRAQHALLTVDDFVPVGTSWGVRALQANADKLIRAQGNQAGRARLNDVSRLQTTMYPRGILLSTGEDIPEGHSVRGRMLILELSPGDVKPEKLTPAQGGRILYPRAMASWITWLAGTDYEERFHRRRKEIREANIGTGHSRTPSIVGDLVATAELMGEWMTAMGLYSPANIAKIVKQATSSVLAVAGTQNHYLEDADPVKKFFATIKEMIATGSGHVRTATGGIPAEPQSWGWTAEQASGELPTYKAKAHKLGWIDVQANEFLFDPSLVPLVIKYAKGGVSQTKQTLLKRIKEGGYLTRQEDTRSRTTVRQTIEGHVKTVLAIRLDAIKQGEE